MSSPRWWIVFATLLCAHLASAAFYAWRFETGRVTWRGVPVGSLDASFDEWQRRLPDRDSTVFLQVATNIDGGQGVVARPIGSDPSTAKEPFYYWAPGAPVVYARWLKWFNGQTMWTFFAFSFVWQLLAGAVLVAMAALHTRSTGPLALAAAATGLCLPVQSFYYGPDLTSSDLVAWLPLALTFYCLDRALVAYWEPRPSVRSVLLWFGLTGLFLGAYSLVRDFGSLAWFVIAVLAVRTLWKGALWRDRRRATLGLSAAAALLLVQAAVRYPVQQWNAERIGRPVVSTASSNAIWLNGLWARHDAIDWYDPMGIGMGHYLDPEAARRVEAYFQSGQPNPKWYSLREFLGVLWNHPLEAIAYRAQRLPVLWLAVDPFIEPELIPALSTWCVVTYLLMALYIALLVRRGARIPEVVYLYPLYLWCASGLIHYEFRYTFPAWITLMLVPGLLLAELQLWAREVGQRAGQQSTAQKIVAPPRGLSADAPA